MLGALATACGGSLDTADAVSRAEIAANAGDYRKAIDICHELTQNGDTLIDLSTQCCRVAVIYALAADNDIDRDESLASAAHWLTRAYAINADSTKVFVEGLTNERAAAANIAVQLLRTESTDLSEFVDPEDPTVLIDHDIDPDAPADEDTH